MKDVINIVELLNALKSAGLGVVVGGIFALFRFSPPSPDNLTGIFGIIGIFSGWVIVSMFISK